MQEQPNVVVFPPVIPATAMVTGVVLGKLVALPLPAAARMLGAPIFAVGIAGFLWMVVTMKRARTPIHNAKTPTALVERGPFRFTRNPMYLFGSVWYAGLALMLGQAWSLALLPVMHLAMHHGVVRREEALLERRFGDAYRAYAARVPRWL